MLMLLQYLNEILSSWLLLLFSLPLATYVTYKVKDTCHFVEEPVTIGDKSVEEGREVDAVASEEKAETDKGEFDGPRRQEII